MILSNKTKRASTLALLLVFALLTFTTDSTTADAQTNRTRARRRQRTTTTTTAARSATRGRSTTTAPIVVPRLPPEGQSARTSNANGTSSTAQQTPTGASVAPSAAAAPQTPAPTPTPQQSAPADAIEDDEDVVRVTSNLVVVPVSVTDAKGEPVAGLKLEDFRLEEEGRRQELAQVGDADQVPLDIAILFDVSSSVSERYKFQQQAAARFLKDVLKPSDRAAIFSITDKPRLEQALASADSAATKLVSIPAASGPTPTAFYDSVVAASKYLAQNAPGRHRRVILVISDGEDNFSEQIRESAVAEYEATAKADNEAEKQRVRASRRRSQQALHTKALAEVQREVQRADAVFYSINPTGPSFRLNEISTRAQQNMQQLAETTGGSSFVPDKLEELESIFRRIAAELRAQYLLQYLSNSDAPPGKFLRIKVQTPTRSELRVRARQGYYVNR
ncbi:MAG TPA: VWA domain-containing protein [Pyrinomonadaceae bacterium]|jgi:VWFA-related protein